MCHLQRSGFVLPAAGQQYSQDLCPSAPTVRVLGLQQPDGVLEMVNCRSESWAEGVRPTLAGFMGAIPDRVTYNTLPGTASLAGF